jgi:glycosyltransferase involved in cell wall biosynthesis
VKVAFVAPVYYVGTSFERICLSIKSCIEAERLDIDYIVISDLPNNLDPAEFDDSHFYKYQLKLLEHLINGKKAYDRLLFIDFFNPGIDILKYELDRNSLNTELYALLHGGTFIEEDLLKDAWISKYEKAWTGVYKRVYVPSRYAFSTLPEFLAQKSSVFSWGLDAVKPLLKPSLTKDIDVVFPHRISSDKGVAELISICELCPEVQFVITSPSGIVPSLFKDLPRIANLSVVTCRDTESYYRILGRSKIVLSCALQELYGYSVAEAVLSGAYPILPNRQVYPEFYQDDNLYDTPVQAGALITEKLRSHKDTLYDARKIERHSFMPLLRDFLDPNS